jgi:hypothetical protein
MKIQMNMNQKKNAIIEKITSQNVTLFVPTCAHADRSTLSAARSGSTGRPRTLRAVEIVVIHSSSAGDAAAWVWADGVVSVRC